jgi:hypothetical protein
MNSQEQVLNSFFQVAAPSCNQIIADPPDLVIALMHAGRFSLLRRDGPIRRVVVS